MPGKKPNGRPTDYSDDLCAKICGLIADGKSLRQICFQDDMPDKATIYRWLFKYPNFSDKYARAKEDCADLYAEEIIEIADDSQGDRKIITRNGVEIEIIDQDAINRARLRVDARKWIASKLKAKKYGDHIAIDQTISAETILVTANGKPLYELKVSAAEGQSDGKH
jgi:hypothetical protein